MIFYFMNSDIPTTMADGMSVSLIFEKKEYLKLIKLFTVIVGRMNSLFPLSLDEHHQLGNIINARHKL